MGHLHCSGLLRGVLEVEDRDQRPRGCHGCSSVQRLSGRTSRRRLQPITLARARSRIPRQGRFPTKLANTPDCARCNANWTWTECTLMLMHLLAPKLSDPALLAFATDRNEGR